MDLLKEIKIVLSILVGIIVSIMVFISCFRIYENRADEMNRTTAIEEKLEYEKKKAVKDMIEEEKELIENFTFYEKLEKGVQLNVLYIAEEDINRYGEYSGKPSWIDEVNIEIGKVTNQAVDYRFISLNGGSILWGWQLFNQLPEDEKYDLVIVESVDQKVDDVELDDFGMIYETFVQDILSLYTRDSILIVRRDQYIGNNFYEVVSQVNDYYGLSEVKMQNPMIQVEMITEEFIQKNVHSKFVDPKLPIYNISDMNSLSFRLVASDSSGFDVSEDLLVSSNLKSILKFDVEHAFYVVTYAVHPDGSELLFYLDKELIKSVDTKSDEIHSKSILIPGKKASELILLSDSTIFEKGIIISVSGVAN